MASLEMATKEERERAVRRAREISEFVTRSVDESIKRKEGKVHGGYFRTLSGKKKK